MWILHVWLSKGSELYRRGRLSLYPNAFPPAAATAALEASGSAVAGGEFAPALLIAVRAVRVRVRDLSCVSVIDLFAVPISLCIFLICKGKYNAAMTSGSVVWCGVSKLALSSSIVIT